MRRSTLDATRRIAGRDCPLAAAWEFDRPTYTLLLAGETFTINVLPCGALKGSDAGLTWNASPGGWCAIVSQQVPEARAASYRVAIGGGATDEVARGWALSEAVRRATGITPLAVSASSGVGPGPVRQGGDDGDDGEEFRIVTANEETADERSTVDVPTVSERRPLATHRPVDQNFDRRVGASRTRGRRTGR